MEKSPLIVILALMVLSFAVGPVKGQDDPEVRKEIEAQYQKLNEAHDRRDLKSILALKTSDFHAIFPDGRIGDHKIMEEYSRNFIERNLPPYNIRITIQKLDVSYNKLIAIAEVLQEATRYREIDGKRRRVDTSVVQRETWSKTPDGWKLKLVDSVRDQKTLIDGELFNANRTEPPKPSLKCNEVIVRDKSHPVWKALDAEFAKFAEAVRKKDLDAMFAFYTPGFQAKEPTGEVWNREQTLGYIRNGFAQVKETIHTSNTILRLAVCGDEATTTVLQQWHRMQMVAGKLRRMETNAVQDLHWVKTPDGWKLGGIDEIKGGAAFLDGKRIDLTKPPDPEAPAYDPYDSRPKQPVADPLFSIITEKGIESALQSYRALKQSNDYYVSESQLNALGHRLLGMKKVREAIEIFKLNVEAYPASANVYDSLGEAYVINGNKELAIKNYQRAVELNPQNTSAGETLKKLRAQ